MIIGLDGSKTPDIVDHHQGIWDVEFDSKQAGWGGHTVTAQTIRRDDRMMTKHVGALPALLILLFMASHAHAGEIEPRAYVNTPVGINFLLTGYVYSDGGLSTSGASPIKDAQLKMHTEILAYARSLDVWGKSGKFDVILPYSQLSGSAKVNGQSVERNVSGLNDPRFRFSVNFYGAPSL